jgi:hypothetical protein
VPRRSTLLPALVAVASLGCGIPAAAAGPMVGTTLGTTVAPAVPPAVDDAPLSLTIDTLTPSSIPKNGKVTVSGLVTNNSDEVWSAVNVHAFVGEFPITSSSELAFQATRGPEESVGDRITVPGTFDTIPELAPGASAPYIDKIPVELLGADEAGVYWFGVHALGSSAAGRDAVADGRARTFLPYVPPQDRGRPIDTALVLPLRHQVLNTPDGTLADVDEWVETLGEGGRLSSILDFGLAAGGLPITWLVDPAVPDSADRLVDGNPARALVERPEGETGAGEEPTGTPADGDSGSAAPQEPAPTGEDPAAVALPWLAKLNRAVSGKQVLALPWGDVDVAAAAKRDVSVYADARALSGTVLRVGQAPMTPAVSAPSGFLDDAAIAVTDPATSILVSDRAVGRGEAPSVATYADRTVVFYSSAVLGGGPGPNDPDSALAMRQQVLSEAALRMDEPGRRPLVVVFPPAWTPPGPDYTQFYDGLDVNWMHLASLADATTQQPQPLAPDRFTYPQWQVNHEVDDAAFTSFADLTEEAEHLQRVISVENDLTARIRAGSLGSLSYAARNSAVRSRVATVSTTGWVRQQLDAISVSGPQRVILSSNSGPFKVTITNGLDEPVSVRIKATSSPPMDITVPDRIDLAASSTTTQLLEASTDKLGVHNVTITVTDLDGNPLGASVELPIRAAQVSQVIWLIMGGAVGLLFLAIVLRLVRRIRGTGPSGDDSEDAEPPPSDDPGGEAAPAPEPEPAAAPAR